jgi:hypothetical protein
MTDFAYICFVNNNSLYINLLKSTIDSVIGFSKYKIIVYAIDVPNGVFQEHPRLEIRNITYQPEILSIFYYKPWIIRDALARGLSSGYYIECDDVITPQADDYLISQLSKCTGYPISPIHPDDPEINERFMKNIGVEKRTQHYIHGHVLFNQSCKDFVQEWFENCLKSFGECWDESVLNCMYWKKGLTNHYMPIIDPYYTEFYTDRESTGLDVIVSYHGCKNPDEQYKLFMNLYTKITGLVFCRGV